MTLAAGMTVTLLVAREKSPYGYFLSDGQQDVLLHYSQVTGTVAIGDHVEVFLHYDTEDRLAATMQKPLLFPGEMALLEVVDRHPRFGCFLDMGLGRNLLLPNSELPEYEELQPQPGDAVYVLMTHDKQGRLLAKAAGEHELAPLTFRAPTSWKNIQLEARVYKTLQSATFVLCDGGAVGFGVIGLLHESERTRPLRMGEKVSVRVAFIREDGRVNVSMRPLKQQGRDEDAERLLAVLRERPNGAMPYSDETPADIISKRFGMSKAAFKRALGKLMKEKLVVQNGSWTHLQQNKEQ